MYRKIVDSISLDLFEYFGDDYDIYTENIKQEFEPPCFYIKLLSPIKRRELGHREGRVYNFAIHYFGNEKNEELAEVGELLFDILSLIDIDDKKIWGSSMRYEVVDGVLIFYVNYDVKLERELEAVGKMEIIKQGGVNIGRNE